VPGLHPLRKEFSCFAKLVYPYHPLFNASGMALEIIGERSDMLVARLPDGSRRGIPSWMFDEMVCAGIHEGDRPTVDVASLVELMDLLERNGQVIRSVADEVTDQSQEKCGPEAAVEPVNTSVGKRPDRAKNTGGKKARMHRAAARVDRSGRRSKTSARRSQ